MKGSGKEKDEKAAAVSLKLILYHEQRIGKSWEFVSQDQNELRIETEQEEKNNREKNEYT